MNCQSPALSNLKVDVPSVHGLCVNARHYLNFCIVASSNAVTDMAARSMRETALILEPLCPEEPIMHICTLRVGNLELHFEYHGVVNYALQQNRAPIVTAMTLTNVGDIPLENLEIRLVPQAAWTQKSSSSEENAERNVDPEIENAWSTRLASLQPQEAWGQRDITIDFSRHALAHTEERTDGHLEVYVQHDGKSEYAGPLPLQYLAYNQWQGSTFYPQSLASFVLPNHPSMPIVLDKMRTILERSTRDGSLSGYQQNDPERVRKVAASAYTAIQELGFTYINPPASFEIDGQKVRTPELLVRERMATCLDITLLVCGALEAAGLHTTIVMVEGHAFAGVWFREMKNTESVIRDAASVRKSHKLLELLLFDPTAALNAHAASFQEAEKKAAQELKNDARFRCMIDVSAARASGIRPLPHRIFGDDGRMQLLDHRDREKRVRTDAFMHDDRHERRAQRETKHRETLERAQSNDPVEAGEARLDRWRGKLLDLTLRNRMLNFRHSKSTVLLMHHDMSALEDALASGKSFELISKPDTLPALDDSAVIYETLYDENEDLAPFLDLALAGRRIHTAYPTREHANRLKDMYRDGRTGLQESGVNPLHVAIGFMRWFETDKPDTPRLAPLILLPAQLQRMSATDRYKLTLADDEVRLNPSFLERLRQDFGIDIPELSILPKDASGFDVEMILAQFRKAVQNLKGWDVIESAFLGALPLGKFMMWHDLHVHEERLLEHPTIGKLLDPSAQTALLPSQKTEADEQAEDQRLFCVMDADASQMDAVRAAAQGESYVLQGPPGTGKSQTITNIIAQSLADGKRVLFVAEKRAALDVVYKRLCDVGLDDFCLRLHSENANKRQVAEQLAKALQQAGKHDPTNWQQEIAILQQKRRALDAYAEDVHHVYPVGWNVYQAVGRLAQLSDVEQVEFRGEQDPATITSEDVAKRMRAVAAMVDTCAQASPINDHPLREWRTPCVHPDSQREISNLLRTLQELSAKVQQQLESLPAPIPQPNSQVIRDLFAHSELLALVERRPPGARTLLLEEAWDLQAPRLEEAIQTGQRHADAQQKLLEVYHPEILSADVTSWHQKLMRWKNTFFLFAFFVLWGVRRQITRMRRTQGNSSYQQLAEDMQNAIVVQDLEAKLNTLTISERLSGGLWQRAQTDWQQLQDATTWVNTYRRYAAKTREPQRWLELGRLEFLPWDAHGGRTQEYQSSVQQLSQAWQNFTQQIELDLSAWNTRSDTWLVTLDTYLARWIDGQDRLRTWSLYLDACQHVHKAGLGGVVTAFEENRLSSEQLVETAEKSITRWWTERIIADNESLLRFNGRSYERLAQEFSSVDTRLKSLARDEILARLSARLPNLQIAAKNSEVGILLREIQKRRRHRPIRELFAHMPTILPQLAPCVLMSPMSVAQFLDDTSFDFDLVIFDEASQIPPWSAIGSIARAAQCIVVGDSKQLPPTSFFSKSYEEDDIQDVEDLESILDECVAIGLNTRSIRWHYRSRDESLISFSNHHYYDNTLMTFPSAFGEAQDLGVSLRDISHGVYDKGKTRTNRAEAEAIVSEIVQRLRDPSTASRSIGVVTFSIAQRTLIEDLLDQARGEFPEIEPYFSNIVPEPVFVKNLENVQGDERDVMLFSICYAPDKDGKLSMHFGPLNAQGGERRLNVAITRAREQLIVFSTLKPEQIDLSRTAAPAVAQLKEFLTYARNGAGLLGAENATHTQTSRAILQELADELERENYRVRTNIGHSTYPIDLAVSHPDQPDYLMLGVELDGSSFRDSTSRDRVVTRPNVLKNLGWNLYRLWTPDLWHNPAAQVDLIRAAIEEHKNQPPPVMQTRTNPTEFQEDDLREENTQPIRIPSIKEDQLREEQAQRAWADTLLDDSQVDFSTFENAFVYRTVHLPEDIRDKHEFDNEANLHEIASCVRQIAIIEAPVYVGDVARRVARHYGYRSVSKRIEETVRRAIAQEGTSYGLRVWDEFVWSGDTQPETYKGFRPANENTERRPFDEIATEEIANAAHSILQATLSLPMDELQRQLAQVFGFASRGRTVRERAEHGVQLLVSQGRAEYQGDAVKIVRQSAHTATG